MAFGLAIVSATVLGVDLLGPDAASPTPALGAPLYLLFFGTMAAWCSPASWPGGS